MKNGQDYSCYSFFSPIFVSGWLPYTRTEAFRHDDSLGGAIWTWERAVGGNGWRLL